MLQKELENVRKQALYGLQNAQELLEESGAQCDSSIVKRIIETVSMAYSSLLPAKFENKEYDEKVRFLVDELKYYLNRL